MAVSGDLEEIRLLDRGFDYEEVPIVTITGGNGSGANVQVSMKSIDHIEKFDSKIFKFQLFSFLEMLQASYLMLMQYYSVL